MCLHADRGSAISRLYVPEVCRRRRTIMMGGNDFRPILRKNDGGFYPSLFFYFCHKKYRRIPMHGGRNCEYAKERNPVCRHRYRLNHHQSSRRRRSKRTDCTLRLPQAQRPAGGQRDRVSEGAFEKIPGGGIFPRPHRLRRQDAFGPARPALCAGGGCQFHRRPEAVQKCEYRHRTGRPGRQGSVFPQGHAERPA